MGGGERVSEREEEEVRRMGVCGIPFVDGLRLGPATSTTASSVSCQLTSSYPTALLHLAK